MRTVVILSPAEIVPSFMAQCLDAAIFSEAQARRGVGGVRTVDFMKCLPISDEPDHMSLADMFRARRTVCDMELHGTYLSQMTKHLGSEGIDTCFIIGVPWPTKNRQARDIADTLLPYVDHVITWPGAQLQGHHSKVTALRHFMRMDDVQECARNIYDSFAPLSRINGWERCSCPQETSQECRCPAASAKQCQCHEYEHFPRNLDQFIQWMWYSRE